MQSNFLQNRQYAQSLSSYTTPLSPVEQQQFLTWVAHNKIPFDPTSPVQDYDMQGYWKDIASKGKSAQALNPNDNLMHFPDTYKTPYHQSFSAESKYAKPGAPVWNEKDQLIDPATGRVVFDERSLAAKLFGKR